MKIFRFAKTLDNMLAGIPKAFFSNRNENITFACEK